MNFRPPSSQLTEFPTRSCLSKCLASFAILACLLCACGSGNGTNDCDTAPACMSLLQSTHPELHLAFPSTTGLRFQSGFYISGATNWHLTLHYHDTPRRLGLQVDDSPAFEKSLNCPKLTHQSAIEVSGLPVCYDIAPNSASLGAIQGGVFYLLTTPRPAALSISDVGLSGTRYFLMIVVRSLFQTPP
jgi:hypothetical protein